MSLIGNYPIMVLSIGYKGTDHITSIGIFAISLLTHIVGKLYTQ